VIYHHKFVTDYLTGLVKNLYWMLTLNTMMMLVNLATVSEIMIIL